MAQIPIKSRPGTYTTIPDEVVDKIGKWGWYLNNSGYPAAHLPGSGGKGRKVLLSRAVIWAMTGEWPPAGMEIDHIDHDPLNNSMENLRVVTKSGNMKNRNKQEGAASKLQGVYWDKRDQRWVAKAGVSIDGKLHTVRSSLTPDEIIAGKCADCIRDLVGGWHPSKLNNPELSFLTKWREIGEKQRRQIFHSMEKHNVPIYDNTIFIAQKVA